MKGPFWMSFSDLKCKMVGWGFEFLTLVAH